MPTTFLLVDDDRRNLEVLEALLAPFDATCLRAEDGRAALALVEAKRPDLVLLDLTMPDLDGIDVLLHLRGAPETAELPVIVVTAHADRERRVQALEAGADEFLEKPVDGAILHARVRTLLRLESSREELAKANALLERQYAAVVAAEQAKRELHAFLVHDLKNPLTALSLDLAYLSRTTTDDAVRTVAGDAASSASRLRTMLEELLTIARLDDASTLVFERKPIDLPSLFAEVMHAMRRAADEREARMEAVVADGATMRGDPELMRRVLENLLENAIRHTPRSGEIRLECEVGEAIVIRVANTGTPIPADRRGIIFDRFARGSAPAARGHVGLGLYFCKRVAEVHGGSIELSSADSAFTTTFVVRLPRS